MRFHVLGGLLVTGAAGPAVLGGPKERVVLAHLVAAANQVVGLDALAESVWSGAPPRTAAKSLQTYVLRLRNALEPDRGGNARILLTRPGGYELVVGEEDLDATLFERLAAQGRQEVAARRYAEAAQTLRAALGLWRGEPFPELAQTDVASALTTRLSELRLQVVEHRLDADLGRGISTVTAELTELVAAHPLRERFWAQLMRAHYLGGRQAEALDTYRRARDRFRAELGIDPGAELRELHTAVLRHDPALAPLPAALRPDGALVGRAAEMDALRTLWDSAEHCVAHLVGPPGIGKTRLVAELAAQVRDAGFSVYQAPDAPAAGDLLISAGAVPSGEWRMVVVTSAASRPSDPGWHRIELGPLPTEAIARLLAGWGAPVDLAGRAQGNPGAAHRLAHTHLRERVTAAARVAEHRRTDSAAARDDLVGSVEDLAGVLVAHADTGTCPYPGLAAFEMADAANFHGREHLVAQLVARLATTRLLGVVGPSGSGKSSLVRAGLLTALRAGALPGSEEWAITIVRPGPEPVDALSADGVVFVDQFEEVFTGTGDHTGFIDAVVTARAKVVLALRADYYGHCGAHPELARLLGDGHVLVGAMRDTELLRAVERPAARAGLHLEDGLADALVGAVSGRIGALPLLSAALRELWEQRDGPSLTLRSYAESGGVEGAVARLAERAYHLLPVPDTARIVFLRLTGPGADGRAVRRRVRSTELADLPVPGVDELVRIFTAARVLTSDHGHVEMTHEALLHHWPRLTGWLREDVDGRALHRRLTAAAASWADGGHEPADLYRGARLVAALDWADGHSEELTGVETAFLDAGRAHAETEARTQLRRNRRLRWLAVVLVGLLLAAVAGGWRAMSEQARADAASVSADARRLGAQALIERDLGLAMLLAVRAVKFDDSAHTRGNLLATLQRSPDLLGVTGVNDGDRLLALTTSPDQKIAATASFTGQIRLYDAATLRLITTLHDPMHRPVFGLAFTSRGLVSWSGRDGIVVWDVDRGSPVARWSGPGGEASGAVIGDTLVLCHAESHTLSRWDLATGAATELMPCDRVSAGNATTVVVAGADGTVLYDVRTGERRTVPVRGGAALSPDGATVVAVPDETGEIQLWDAATGTLRASSHEHTSTVMTVRWSPDGTTFASGANDRRAIVWDAATLRPLHVLSGHAGRLMNQAYANNTLLTAALDGSLLMWDLSGERGLHRRVHGPQSADEYVNVVFDGRWAVAIAPDRADVLDLADGRVHRRLDINSATGADLADGRLAVSYEDGSAQLWDIGDGTHRRIGTQATAITSIAVSKDRTAFATETLDGAGRIEVAGHRLSAPAPVVELRFSPDGRHLFAGLVNGQVVVWREEQQVALLDVHPAGFPVWTFDFSPDGSTVAIGGALGRPSLWHIGTWQRRWQASVGHNGYDQALSFAPDGRSLASSGTDSLTFLYDTESGDLLGNAFGEADNRDVYAHHLPGRTVLAAVGATGEVSHWDVDPASWLRRACATAGRDLTPAEWQRHLPGRGYRPTCSASG